MQMKFSVLIHKATRGSKVAESGLTYKQAVAKGTTIYEGWKALHRSFPELTVPGVCVRLVNEDDPEVVIEQYGSC